MACGCFQRLSSDDGCRCRSPIGQWRSEPRDTQPHQPESSHGRSAHQDPELPTGEAGACNLQCCMHRPATHPRPDNFPPDRHRGDAKQESQHNEDEAGEPLENAHGVQYHRISAPHKPNRETTKGILSETCLGKRCWHRCFHSRIWASSPMLLWVFAHFASSECNICTVKCDCQTTT